MRWPAERGLMIITIPLVKEFQRPDRSQGLSLLLTHHLEHLTFRREATSPTTGFPEEYKDLTLTINMGEMDSRVRCNPGDGWWLESPSAFSLLPSNKGTLI